MDLDSVMENRHSVRSFTTMAPPDRDIERLVFAAQLAPTAGNLNARRIFTFKGGKISGALHQEWAAQAPYLIIFCADLDAIEKFGERGRDLYCIQDASIAATYSMLKATDLGLGSCWIGSFDEEEIKKVAGLPEHLRPVTILAVGYEK